MTLRHITFLLGLTALACVGCSQTATAPTRQSPSAEHDQSTVVQVCRITAELLGVNSADVEPSTSLGDLGADELDIVELVMELEEHFDVFITDEAIGEVTGDEQWQAGADKLTMSKLAEIVDEGKRGP